jgi:hypothetical protein
MSTCWVSYSSSGYPFSSKHSRGTVLRNDEGQQNKTAFGLMSPRVMESANVAEVGRPSCMGGLVDDKAKLVR